jgi:hypothetical protein
MPSDLTAVWSCVRPGRTAPAHRVRPWPSLITVGLRVFCLRLPEMNARRPGRWARAGGPGSRCRRCAAPRRWPPRRRPHPPRSAAAAWAGRGGKPRAASSGRIWPMARVMVARSTPSSTARAWCGSCRRSTIRVASTRSHKTSRWWGPAPAARRRGWPRRWANVAWCWAVQGSASSAMNSPRCCRAMPVKQGWDRAARPHVGGRIPA